MSNITQTSTPFQETLLPSKAALTAAFVGKKLTDLRTPAAIVDRSLFENNCNIMAEKTEQLGITFRAHVKTHKTTEGLRYQLQAQPGGVTAVVCSTLIECWHIAKSGLVQEGLVKDMLYGLPCGVDKIQDLQSIADSIQPHAVLRLMIDNPGQIGALEAFNSKTGRTTPWSIFIKVDGGGKRAGLPPTSDAMAELIKKAVSSSAVEIFGFYSHFGQSYASQGEEEAAAFFAGEVACVNSAAGVALSLGAKPAKPFTLSIGATPTAHAANQSNSGDLNGKLELHAGCYCCLDLQQVATQLVPLSRVSTSVIAHVISLYPHRSEAMCDAGGIAMAKDLGPIPGYGHVVSPESAVGWELGRVSQEHGTLVRAKGEKGERVRHLELGEVVRIVGQHACMTLAAYPWYYVVEDGGDTVVDVWVPWKGW
ncbi:hypothetical protein T439DRAFT_319020 [Meredithblackwellia eburnea MCA 4105]